MTRARWGVTLLLAALLVSTLAATLAARPASTPLGPAASAVPDSSVPLTSPVAPVAPVAEAEVDIARLRQRSLLIPVASVQASELQDTYLQARGGGAREHEALDIAAPRGTPVFAVEDGRIAKKFTSQPGGLTVYQFDEAREFAYYYAHLDRYAEDLREGMPVRKGQVIGYVGSTGNAAPEAPHLHFAIFRLGPEQQWWRGTPLNPFGVWRSR